MPVPHDKTTLLHAIQTNYEKLGRELATIPETLSTIQNMEGHAQGTRMSINNLLSYLIGWGTLVLKWHQELDKGRIPDFPETGFKWNELGNLARKFYDDFAAYDFTTLTAKLDEIVSRITTLVTQTSDEMLYEQAWYKKYTMGRMIQLNTAAPYRNALLRVRKWKKLYAL